MLQATATINPFGGNHLGPIITADARQNVDGVPANPLLGHKMRRTPRRAKEKNRGFFPAGAAGPKDFQQIGRTTGAKQGPDRPQNGPKTTNTRRGFRHRTRSEKSPTRRGGRTQ